MTVRVVHCLAVKFLPAFRGTSATGGKGTMVTMPIIQTMIDMPIEMLRSVEPRTGTDKQAVCEPFGAIVSVGRTIVGRDFVVAIGAIRRWPDINGNLCLSLVTASDKKT